MSEKNEKLPYGCTHLDEARKTAVFDDPEYAWSFNACHLGWRVIVNEPRKPVPALYEKLADGGWCDPDSKRAAFNDFRSAWLFGQMMPGWSVDYIDVMHEEMEAELYRIDGAAMAGLLGVQNG